jgi:hypothetical protein
MQRYTVYFIWKLIYMFRVVLPPTISVVDTEVCAPDFGWRYHPKHVDQYRDKINCVMLHLVGYILEYYSDARTHER